MMAASVIVRGTVQGVWFRAATREQAQQLGLQGHARNLSEGSVQVLACGDEAAITRLQSWLAIGPPQAFVTEVIREDTSASVLPSGFEIL